MRIIVLFIERHDVTIENLQTVLCKRMSVKG